MNMHSELPLFTLTNIDVQENVKTVNKRLLLAVDQLSAADVFIQPKVLTENGLPITEIMEELDEDGNVVCPYPCIPGRDFRLNPSKQAQHRTQVKQQINSSRLCGKLQ